MGELQTQLTIGMVVPFVLQYLKSQKWFPLLSMSGGMLNRITAGIVAIATGFGITAHFGDGTLTLSGLTLANIWAGAQHSIMQYMVSHTVYKAAVAPPLAGAVQAQARTVAGGGTETIHPG